MDDSLMQKERDRLARIIELLRTHVSLTWAGAELLVSTEDAIAAAFKAALGSSLVEMEKAAERFVSNYRRRRN